MCLEATAKLVKTVVLENGNCGNIVTKDDEIGYSVVMGLGMGMGMGMGWG